MGGLDGGHGHVTGGRAPSCPPWLRAWIRDKIANKMTARWRCNQCPTIFKCNYNVRKHTVSIKYKSMHAHIKCVSQKSRLFPTDYYYSNRPRLVHQVALL